MPVSVPRKTLGTVAENVPQGTPGCTALHGALVPRLESPPGQVVRRGQALCAGPDCPGHYTPRHSEDDCTVQYSTVQYSIV